MEFADVGELVEAKGCPVKNGDKVTPTFMQSVIIEGCSGTMLTNEWAIGCQHCYPSSFDDRTKDMFVYYDGKKDPDYSGKLFKQKRRIVEVVRHPSNTAGGDVNFRTRQGFDVALFRLETPLTIDGKDTGFVRRLWPGQSSELAGQDLLCVGWGLVSADKDSMDLRQAVLKPTVQLEEVVAGKRVGDRLHVGPNAKSQITMKGDSGCGCYVQRDGQWYLASINAGGSESHGFSMSVAHPEIRSWIMNVVHRQTPSWLRNEWESFPEATLATGPVAALTAPGRIEVFAGDDSRRLIQKRFETTVGEWTLVALKSGRPVPAMLDSPAAIAWGPERLDCFLRGADNRVHHLWNVGGTWLDIEPFDQVVGSGPAVASWAPGRLDLFALHTDGQLRHKVYDGTWRTWESLPPEAGVSGRRFSGRPAAVSWGPDRIDCFVRGLDGRLVHIWYDHGWGGTEVFDGVVSSSPCVMSRTPGTLEIFARGQGGNLLHKQYDTGRGWGSWLDLGGHGSTAPAAAAWGPLRIDCFVRGDNGLLYHDRSQ